MEFETQISLLDRAFGISMRGEWDAARQISLPVIEQMNSDLYGATRRTHLPGLSYEKHYLNFNDYLTVLCAQGFSGTSLDSVTAISWNMYFNDDGIHTLIGSLVRLGKRYGIYDYPTDARAVRSLAFLTLLVANKLSRPRDNRLVVSAPSSMRSTNTLPRQLAELLTATSKRYELAHPKTLERCRDIGPMKDISDVSEKLRLVKDSMVANAEFIQGRQVLLVDDLLGSGGTLREAARALKTAGATEVHALVMAKTRKYAKETMCKA